MRRRKGIDTVYLSGSTTITWSDTTYADDIQTKQKITRSDWHYWKNYIRAKTRTYISQGILTPPDRCYICNADIVLEVHHSDYRNATDVLWLCRSCHNKISMIARSKTSDKFPEGSSLDAVAERYAILYCEVITGLVAGPGRQLLPFHTQIPKAP